ncbi:hypothetical protein [Azospirillum canadense]|uniref:hypothetical protein n=1 Tax=Azospirillum canadense TaxID=403962 RepID=UPI002226092F|nr:hypothetical protein [Azospirillum canadense]MCW2241353.1 hypothetical protein [Azospirillum canadense]
MLLSRCFPAVAIVLTLLAPLPAWAAAQDATARVEQFSRQVTAQAKIYGIQDRCFQKKQPALELRPLLTSLKAKKAPDALVELVRVSYVEGIKNAGNVNCQFAPALLKDIAKEYEALATAAPSHAGAAKPARK